MKIAVIDTIVEGAPASDAHVFLPRLLEGLTGKGHEIHLVVKPAAERFFRENTARVDIRADLWPADGFVEETAPVLADWLNELAPDVYLIWASDDIGWVVLPLLNPRIATLTVGHADSEAFYLPARHYRQFLTRLIGVSPEVSIGYVLSSVVEKEKVEWIPYYEQEEDGGRPENPEDVSETVKNYESCFARAVADAQAAPRETYRDFPLPETLRSRVPVWLRKLKGKLMS